MLDLDFVDTSPTQYLREGLSPIYLSILPFLVGTFLRVKLAGAGVSLLIEYYGKPRNCWKAGFGRLLNSMHSHVLQIELMRCLLIVICSALHCIRFDHPYVETTLRNISKALEVIEYNRII